MNSRFRRFILIVLMAVFPTNAWGEIRPQSREIHASHVIVGRVLSVKEVREGRRTDYAIRIQIESIERGDGFAAGEEFMTQPYSNDMSGGWRGAAGHRPIPMEGDRVRVFLAGGVRGVPIYPEWCDILDYNLFARVLRCVDFQTSASWYFYGVVTMVVSAALAIRTWRKRRTRGNA